MRKQYIGGLVRFPFPDGHSKHIGISIYLGLNSWMSVVVVPNFCGVVNSDRIQPVSIPIEVNSSEKL